MAINRAVLAKKVDGIIEYVYPKTTADMVEYSSTESVKDKIDSLISESNNIDMDLLRETFYTKEEIDNMAISYSPIEVSSLSVSPSVAEVGSSQTVTVSWNLSREPQSLTLNNDTMVASQTGSKSFNNVTSDTTYTLVVQDRSFGSNAGSTVTKSASINFYNAIYYGVGGNVAPNSSFINTLSGKKLTNSISMNFSVNAGSDEYIWFACPDDKSPTFKVNGFSGGFNLVSTINYTNTYNNTSSYKVFRSTNPNLGSTDVSVN